MTLYLYDFLLGSKHGIFRNQSFTLETAATLKSGVNNISLLSNMVGLPVYFHIDFFPFFALPFKFTEPTNEDTTIDLSCHLKLDWQL